MAVYDCIMYFNETDVLRMHLAELYPHVDKFYITEATHTFTGKQKPYYFDDLPEWIEEYEDKIHRNFISFPDKDMTPWERETYQRNMSVPIVDAADDDKIVICDADEIPRPTALRYSGPPIHLDVTQYFWNLNWQVPAHCNQGARPVLLSGKDLYKQSPQEMRAAQLKRVQWGGWHFSFLGSHEVPYKLAAFSHTELDLEEYRSLSEIDKRVATGMDPFDRFPLRYTKIDGSYPRWVQKHQQELSHLMM